MHIRFRELAYIFTLFAVINLLSVRTAPAQIPKSEIGIAVGLALSPVIVWAFIGVTFPRSTLYLYNTHQIQNTNISRTDIAEVLSKHRGFKAVKAQRENESEFVDSIGQVAILVKHKRKGKHRFRVIGAAYYRRFAPVFFTKDADNWIPWRLGGIPRREAKALLRSIAAELEARSKTARVPVPNIETP